MNTTEARLQLSRARTACLIALAALTGMRKSELAELTNDCRLPPEQLGEGRVRYRLKGKVIKGRKLGGEHDQWVTIKQAYDTAGVVASLADPVKNTGHLFKSLSFFTPYEWFLTWVNAQRDVASGWLRSPRYRSVCGCYGEPSRWKWRTGPVVCWPPRSISSTFLWSPPRAMRTAPVGPSRC
ncbi:hypothetical protein ACWDYJ_21920 [Streptomyces sp. NPDC003042]